MPYVRKKWYRLNRERLIKDFSTIYNFEKKNNIKGNNVYNIYHRKAKVSKDNQFFEVLKPYLDEIKG